jgi:hypothetical protein
MSSSAFIDAAVLGGERDNVPLSILGQNQV